MRRPRNAAGRQYRLAVLSRRTPSDVSEKKAYPLRINAAVIEAMQKWSDDELRSLNAQIEYVLRDALRKAGRLKSEPRAEPDNDLS